MTEHLTIFMPGAILVSVPLMSERQQEAARRIFQGERNSGVFVIIESEPRRVIEV